jgi:O-acetyl-ADP-ribose deacetylase (regulator of RNase III)
MPADMVSEPMEKTLTLERMLELRRQFDVSVEAVLLRMVRLTDQPVTIVAASRQRDIEGAPYRIDYSIPSRTSPIAIPAGFQITGRTVLSECTAIGYTSKRVESWGPHSGKIEVECVGVAPYPGRVYPRVVGILRAIGSEAVTRPSLRYLYGDACEPRGTGMKIIAHIVNDKTPNWGAGFALAVSQKWPEVQSDFKSWVNEDRTNLSLGRSHISNVSEEIAVCHMVAQHGYGHSDTPRIRYAALKSCLSDLGKQATRIGATVHMPMIGTGQAGGNWSVISDIILEDLVGLGVDVTVYKQPKYGANIGVTELGLNRFL